MKKNIFNGFVLIFFVMTWILGAFATFDRVFAAEPFFQDKQDVQIDAPEEKKVILFLSSFDIYNDQNPQSHSSNTECYMGDQVLEFENFKKSVQKIFPHRAIRQIISNNPVDFKNQLDQILQPGEQISHLYWMGFGNSKITKGLDVSARVSMGFTVGKKLINIEAAADGLGINNVEAVDFFSGIAGRFLPGAIVLFEVGYIFEQNKLTKELAAELVKVLGLKDGYLYGSRNAVSSLIYFLKRFFFRERLASRFFFGSLSFQILLSALTAVLFFSDAALDFKVTSSIIALTSYLILAFRSCTGNDGYIFLVKAGEVKSFVRTKVFEFKRLFFQKHNTIPLTGFPQ
jgi:hypothetical protein